MYVTTPNTVKVLFCQTESVSYTVYEVDQMHSVISVCVYNTHTVNKYKK